jgi:predicted AlkP superfamily phosphohydrolase/phosphomutase
MNSLKVILLGLDGAAFNLLDDLFDAGKMPNLKKMAETGTRSGLNSTIPPDSAPSWPSMITGCNAAKHSMYDFTEKQGYSLAPRSPHFPKGLPLWDLLSANGKKVGFINVPLTFPPAETDGFVISGFPVPEHAEYTFPKSLQAEIEDVTNGYLIEIDMREDDDAVIAQLNKEAEKRTAAALHMMKTREWDFLMVVYTGTDRMQHDFWRYFDKESPAYNTLKSRDVREKVSAYMEHIDSCIGKIRAGTPDNTVMMVVSDHGSGPLHKYININSFLLEKGYLRLKGGAGTKFRKFVYDIGITPKSAYSFARAIGVKKIRQKSNEDSTVTRIMKRLFLSYENDVDWGRSQAFYVGMVGWGPIYINLAGREPKGSVAQDEYEQVRDKIIADVRAMEYQGRKIVIDVWKREQVFSGPYLDKAPDIIFRPIDGYSCFYAHNFASISTVMSPFGISGDHRFEGILIASGPGIAKGRLTANPTVMDITPTVLQMFGLAIPDHIDGKPIMEMFEKNSAFARPPRSTTVSLEAATQKSTGWSEEQSKEIEERLRSMGYLG